ncbi:MAG: RNA polymerase sigma factor [Cyclobacteriaceae bacterium]
MKILTKNQFLTTFDHFYSDLRNFAYYKTGSIKQAEEIAQEAFLVLWQRQAQIKNRSLINYLYDIVSQQAAGYANEKLTLKFAKKEAMSLWTAFKEPEITLTELDIKLQEAISTVSENQRVAFLMNQVDGLKYYEIAERLGISLKTVEQRILSTLRQMCHVFEKEFSLVNN